VTVPRIHAQVSQATDTVHSVARLEARDARGALSTPLSLSFLLHSLCTSDAKNLVGPDLHSRSAIDPCGFTSLELGLSSSRLDAANP